MTKYKKLKELRLEYPDLLIDDDKKNIDEINNLLDEAIKKAEFFDRLLPHLYITYGCIELRLYNREMREIHKKIKTHNGLSITNDELMKDLNDFQDKLLKGSKQ